MISSAYVHKAEEHTILSHVVPNFSQRVTDGRVGIQDGRMLPSIPFFQRRQLLRDCSEKSNDDTHWSSFHVVAEFGDHSGILHGKVSRIPNAYDGDNLLEFDSDSQTASLPRRQAG